MTGLRVMSDLDLKHVLRGLRNCTVGHDIRLHQTLESTMDEAKNLAERGAPEGTVVIAEEQRAGRGRFERSWVSEPGKDLLFSVVFRPTAAQAPYVNMAAALAVRTTVGEATGLDTTIKWPNDVKLEGRKVSGILVESTVSRTGIEYTVLGGGLNINSNPADIPEIAPIATSMYRETGRTFDRSEVLIRVLRDLDGGAARIRAGHSLKADWAAHLETLGQNVIVRWRNNIDEGIATDVDEMGNLILTKADGTTKSVVAGEVTLQA